MRILRQFVLGTRLIVTDQVGSQYVDNAIIEAPVRIVAPAMIDCPQCRRQRWR